MKQSARRRLRESRSIPWCCLSLALTTRTEIWPRQKINLHVTPADPASS